MAPCGVYDSPTDLVQVVDAHGKAPALPSVCKGMVPPESEKKIAWSVAGGKVCQMLVQEFCDDVVELPTRCPRLLSVMAQVAVSPLKGATGYHCEGADPPLEIKAACQPPSGDRLPACSVEVVLRGGRLVVPLHGWESLAGSGPGSAIVGPGIVGPTGTQIEDRCCLTSGAK